MIVDSITILPILFDYNLTDPQLSRDYGEKAATGEIAMKSKLGIAAACALLSAPLFAGAARADVVFDFSGLCGANCSGTATGVLTLTNDYVFGSNITADNFVSFSYTSSDLIFKIQAADSPLFSFGTSTG